MAKIHKLQDRNSQETIYPQTITEAVLDSDGNDLETRLVNDKEYLESQLSNVLAEDVIDSTTTPEISTVTREELKKDLFRDLWLATLAMFPLMPTYEADVAATLPDGSQYGLNGLVMPYDIAVKVMLWSKPTEMYSAGCYSYDYCLPSDIPTLFPFWGASGTPNLNNAFRACQYVTVLSVYSSVGLIIRPVQATNLFAACRRLEKIYGIIDLQYIKQSSVTNSIFMLCSHLTSVNVKNLNCDISIAQVPMVSLESLDYMVTNATNTSTITITVHPDVYAKLTDEANAEWHQVLLDAAAKNITFATT